MVKMLIGSLFGIVGTFTNITFGIHNLIAIVYSTLVDMGGDFGSVGVNQLVTNVRNNLYILIGIFMVFRLGISLINYLINPDAIGDKQAGAGKLLTRIVTSIILLLGMPIIFDFSIDLQNAILKEEGALDNLMNIFENDENFKSIPKYGLYDKYLIENIDAATSSQACNYEMFTTSNQTIVFDFQAGCKFDKQKFISRLNQLYEQDYSALGGDISNGIPTLSECKGSRTENCYEITFEYITSSKYNTESDILIDGNVTIALNKVVGTVKLSKKVENNDKDLVCYYYNNGTTTLFNEQNGLDEEVDETGSDLVKIVFSRKSGTGKIQIGNSDWYMYNDTASVGNQRFSSYSFSKAKYQFGYNEASVDRLLDNKCPPSILNVTCNDNSCTSSKNNTIVRYTKVDSLDGEDLEGGTTSLDELLQKMAAEDMILSDNLSPENKAKIEALRASQSDSLGTETGYQFSRELLKAFANQKETTDELDKWPNEIESKEISKKIDDGKMEDFNWFLSLVFGIAVLVFLIVIAVEIVVRNFKLIILQIMAPIPIISYMNPNDKMFDGWLKQYIGTYVDLFIKLLGIRLVSVLLMRVVVPLLSQGNFLVKISYLIGSIVFMKVAPDFISKLFGIKDMAGTMKQSFGMLKTGLMAATGGALGAGAVLANSGRNAYAAYKGGLGVKGVFGAAGRALLSAPGAALQGIGSGYKGNALGGATNAWSKGTASGSLYRQGIGAGAQMTAGILGTMGLDYASRKDKELENIKSEQENLKRAQSYKDNIQNIGMNGSDFGADILNKRDSDGNFVYTQDQRKKAAKAWASAQYEVHNNGADYRQYCANKGLDASEKNSKDAYISSKLLYNQNLDFMDDADKLKATYEAGKAAQITENVRDAKSFTQLEINGVTRGNNAVSSISSVEDVFELEDRATKKHTANSNIINEATVNDPKYVAADAARKARQGNKN